MIGSFEGCLVRERRRRLLSNVSRILALLIFLPLMGCETLSGLLPFGDATPKEDPALSDDPAVAGKLSSGLLPLQWEWSDAEQRWHYMMGGLTPPQVAMDGWLFETGGVQVRVIAAPQLNQYHDRPHAVMLRVIQLGDRKPFDERRTTTFGLQEMLSINAFDPAAVLSVSEYSLLPGADQVISLDRQLNVRYVGIVAGFYNLDGRRATRLVPIPPMDDTPASSVWLSRLTFGFLGATAEAVPPRPAKLKLLLQLGIDQIDELKVSAE